MERVEAVCPMVISLSGDAFDVHDIVVDFLLSYLLHLTRDIHLCSSISRHYIYA